MKRYRAKLNKEMVSIIKLRLERGDYQHDIAADFGINQGRISEIKTGKRHSSQEPSLF